MLPIGLWKKSPLGHQGTVLVFTFALATTPMLMPGCASESVESELSPRDGVEDTEDEGQDSVPPPPVSAGEWELTPTQIGEQLIDAEAFVPPLLEEMTKAELEQAYENALNDPVWYAANGDRYEALFVTADGVTYGRRGAAPDFPVPTQENAFGAFPGTEAFESDFEVEHPNLGDVVLDVSTSSAGAPPPTTPIDDLFGKPRPAGNYVGTDYWNDDRIRISQTSHLTGYPYRVVGALSSSGSVGAGGCSGAKVGPRAVLTASHCILTGGGNLISSGKFNPGQNNTTALNGSKSWSGLYYRDWRIHFRYDYALLFLADASSTVGLG